MKKIQGFLIIFVLIILVGCRDTNIKPPNNIDENPNGVVDNEKSKSEEVMEEFTEMIQPETDAGDLGIYIRKNIEYVDKTDAEEMIRWLLVYQSEIKIEFIDKIYAPEYLKALNEDMEGVLDKEKVETISDTHIKDDYKKLINGFMTIIRYEEYPVVETDWKELNKFSSYVTEDFKEMLELYQKIQNYEYNREELDVVHLGEDIIKTEEILKRNKSNFVHTQANEIFNLQISSLLIGPEGSHLGFFIDKNTKEYENILELKELYPESFIGQIISDLDKKDFEEPMDIHEEISQRLQFGIDSQL